ncbi:MAG TPA: macro domain-containing protein [Mogibacterium sp.]|nr:macro domain-containing protein [Mogibacterium sp.]
MIIYSEGTVFNIGAQAIVNTVNCTGVMGAGIALEFMLRYPDMFEDYATKCKENIIRTGKVDYYQNKDSSIVINFPTKRHFKYPSQLIWIEQGLQDFVKTYKEKKVVSVAFPKLGTSNGGLDWNAVRPLMERYLSNLDIDVFICLDEKKEAEGVEKDMLEKFNALGIEELSHLVKLNKKQKENIQKNKPYDRFWKISKTESIGIKTYSKIFKHFYDLSMGNNLKIRQLSLLDFNDVNGVAETNKYNKD